MNVLSLRVLINTFTTGVVSIGLSCVVFKVVNVCIGTWQRKNNHQLLLLSVSVPNHRLLSLRAQESRDGRVHGEKEACA